MVPPAVEVDGASIPKLFWSIFGGPFSGKFLKASIIHDYYCDTMQRTAYDTHRNFYYGMRADGVSATKANLMYWAVKTFGPDWKLERKTVTRQICNLDRCFNTIETIVEPIVTSIDLSDPATAEIALQKFSAVAKTLETSNSEYFDISTEGPISSHLDAIDLSASLYRKVFFDNIYQEMPAVLGIIDGTISAEKLPQLGGGWTDGKLPTYEGHSIVGAPDAALAGDGAFEEPITDSIIATTEGKWTLGSKPQYVDSESWTVLQETTSEDVLLQQRGLEDSFEFDQPDFEMRRENGSDFQRLDIDRFQIDPGGTMEQIQRGGPATSIPQ